MDSGWVNVSAALFSAIFVVPVLFVSGALSDRFNRKRVVMAILFLQLMVTLPLLSGLSGSTAVAMVFLGQPAVAQEAPPFWPCNGTTLGENTLACSLAYSHP